ncbi:uncharacterized protein LOC127851699 isoform X3 [Dreissena polymorpha]|uniref:uncharacterized protein LOC127851699 isoform X3 n=1 Tax=Dreissena polymorpha TaxID=45954 RepID=UPI00226450EA|nr:uncharacterized protein LOC127851699 isoform X3 [Dreissena polymorpha]XP_052241550.1 uncharacterized protein LOC127851699 isoform X3 [Dreissena polymorpha]XP_052241555.1 uncharacterized protein LOC127851699 isoform X3 [Dreissena polymorpha]
MAAGMNGQKLTDDICRSVLKNSQKKIVEEMDPERVLVKLRQIEFLSHDDYTAIRGVPDRSKQNLSLLSTIRKSGKQAYCDFKKILKETGQEGIILELESKEKKELGIETAGHYVERKIDQDLARHKRMETNKKPAENPLESLDRSVTVVTVETIQKDLHDGRLITLDNKMIEELKMISWTNDQLKGGFGTVYISNKRVAGFKIRVVLKEIVLKAGNSSQNRKEKSITNEKIASRLMHFGIVPLLAYHDDDINRTYYFVSPYLENGDLYEAIAADRDCREKDIRLRWKTRIKIMYQIACAINFMHTGNEFRRTVLHMDIKSKNIVLDTNFNARLIDFGLAREFIDDDATSIVTPAIAGNLGYSPNAHKLTKNDDYYCFGGVLIELITGLNASASEEGIPLHEWHRELIVQRQQVSVWNETSRTIVDKSLQ